MSEITGLEYVGGVKSPVPGDENKMPVVDDTGTGFKYLPTNEVIQYETSGVDETYAQLLGTFMETEEVKSESGLLVFAPRSRFAVLEDYFMHGIASPIGAQTGALRWTVLGTAPAVSASASVVSPGTVLTYTDSFTLSLGSAVNTPLVDVADFTKMSFMHASDSTEVGWYLGLSNASSPASGTNACGFQGSVGSNIEVFLKSPAGGTQTFDTGVAAVATPQAFKMVSISAGASIEFYIDGVLVTTQAFVSTERMNVQMMYFNPPSTDSVVPMYFSLLKTCAGATLSDGNRDV